MIKKYLPKNPTLRVGLMLLVLSFIALIGFSLYAAASNDARPISQQVYLLFDIPALAIVAAFVSTLIAGIVHLVRTRGRAEWVWALIIITLGFIVILEMFTLNPQHSAIYGVYANLTALGAFVITLPLFVFFGTPEVFTTYLGVPDRGLIPFIFSGILQAIWTVAAIAWGVLYIRYGMLDSDTVRVLIRRACLFFVLALLLLGMFGCSQIDMSA